MAILTLLALGFLPSSGKPSVAAGPNIITVFSTACISFHDWQSEALLYSHYKHKVRGTLIRIDSCTVDNYTYPKIWHPRYSIFRTPSFEQQQNKFGRDKYSGYNRPGGLVYWLEHDKSAALADYIIVLDPDMILRSRLDVNMLGDPVNTEFAGPGRVGGGVYDFGDGWYQQFGKQEMKRLGCPHHSCELSSEELDRLLIGPPMVFTYTDLRTLASPWMEFTKSYRAFDKNKGWAQEMFGLTMALAFHGNRPNVSSYLFVSASSCAMEGWDVVGHAAPGESHAKFKYHPQPLHEVSPVLHYCQSYSAGPGLTFYKYHFTKNVASSLMACADSPYRLPTHNLGKHLALNMSSDGNKDKRRNAYMITEITKDTNEALDHYRKLFC